jgi:carboxymethylenebutenolidase
MCHDVDTQPPAPPSSGCVGRHGGLTLTATDGNRFAAYEAIPERPGPVGAVILPDVRGLHPYYTALAERFAEAGISALAMDYSGRTHGAVPRDETFDWKPAAAQLSATHVYHDSAACVARLRSERDVTRPHPRQGRQRGGVRVRRSPTLFFDRRADLWRDACADAWRRLLAFTDKYSASAGTR